LADYIHDDDVAEECILIEAIERAGRRLAEQSTDAPASTNALDPVPQTGQEGSTRA
jgi:hypothetical protein